MNDKNIKILRFEKKTTAKEHAEKYYDRNYEELKNLFV